MFVHDGVRLFNTEQNHKEIDARITHAYFDIILAEMSSAGTFLQRLLWVGSIWKIAI